MWFVPPPLSHNLVVVTFVHLLSISRVKNLTLMDCYKMKTDGISFIWLHHLNLSPKNPKKIIQNIPCPVIYFYTHVLHYTHIYHLVHREHARDALAVWESGANELHKVTCSEVLFLSWHFTSSSLTPFLFFFCLANPVVARNTGSQGPRGKIVIWTIWHLSKQPC